MNALAPVMPTVYLDTETTGVYPESDELLEIGLVGEDGQVLMQQLVKPRRLNSWPESQRIHGISPHEVAEEPMVQEVLPRLEALVAGARVVIYNADFDNGFLPQVAEFAGEIRCCMREWAAAMEEEGYGGKWWRLGTAARHVGYIPEGPLHRAVADAQACRAVWEAMHTPQGSRRLADLRASPFKVGNSVRAMSTFCAVRSLK